MIDFFILTISLIILYYAADWLVSGAARLAQKYRVPPLVIGLTIVAFGTSAPELLVSVTAAIRENGEIAFANVIGSNIVNIAFILGLSALIRPLTTTVRTIRLEAPVMVASAILLFVFSIDSVLGFLEGGLLVTGFLVFLFFMYRTGKKESAHLSKEVEEEFKDAEALVRKRKVRVPESLRIVFGLAGLIFGANLLIDSAVGLAEQFGLSQKLIGLTIVAIGTSLPELATSTVAAFKGENDISIGNLVGSNIFNILAIAGISSIISPIRLGEGIVGGGYLTDLLLMVFLSFNVWYFMATGKKISRYEGGFLVVIYVAYMFYLSFRT